MAYKIYNMYDDIKDSYKDVHEDDEINASCELPRVNNAFFSDNYDSSMNERKQSLIQLRSPINQKLLEEQSRPARQARLHLLTLSVETPSTALLLVPVWIHLRFLILAIQHSTSTG